LDLYLSVILSFRTPVEALDYEIMGISFSKYFALATLVIFAFMTNVGIWSNHSNWLTHDLEHNVNVIPDRATADYVALHDVESPNDISATSSLAVEHELLHAANHLQFFLGTEQKISFVPISTIIKTYLHFTAIPLASFDAPFRPPRFTSLAI